MTRKCHVRFGGRPMEKAPHGDLASGLPDFEDGDGVERGTVEIVANDVQFLGRRRGKAESDTSEGSSDSTDDFSPDDVPF